MFDMDYKDCIDKEIEDGIAAAFNLGLDYSMKVVSNCEKLMTPEAFELIIATLKVLKRPVK